MGLYPIANGAPERRVAPSFKLGAVDYVAWTAQVAGFAGRTDLQGTPGNI